MGQASRVSGTGLIIAGLSGVAFFLLTDPRVGWLNTRTSDNVVDAIHQGSLATYVGVAGSAVVTMMGFWLVTRRSG